MLKLILTTGLIAGASLAAVGGDMRNVVDLGQNGSPCKVTKAGGSSMFVTADSKDVTLRKGTRLTVVDSEPHQGLIVVKTKMGSKWVQGEIMYENTDCAPVLPK